MAHTKENKQCNLVDSLGQEPQNTAVKTTGPSSPKLMLITLKEKEDRGKYCTISS